MQLREHVATGGGHGPLYIFEWRRAGLLLAWLAGRWRPIPFPKLQRHELAGIIYRLAGLIPVLLHARPHRQIMARHHLEICARRFGFPSVKVPPVRLPPGLQDPAQRRWLGSCLKGVIGELRHDAVRYWLCSRLRYVTTKPKAWADCVNGNKFCKHYTFTTTPTPSALEDPLPPAGLQRLRGAWGLPEWPTARGAKQHRGQTRAADGGRKDEEAKQQRGRGGTTRREHGSSEQTRSSRGGGERRRRQQTGPEHRTPAALRGRRARGHGPGGSVEDATVPKAASRELKL